MRAAHLGRAAAHAQSFAEYERIQKDRLAATPGDATILTNLGYRAMREGTLDQATTYFERAIAVMQENVARYRSEHPTASGAVAGIGDRRIQELRGLQTLLPDFFRQAIASASNRSRSATTLYGCSKTGRAGEF